MALQDTDVTVPRTLAVHPEHEAMLSERISGENWFYRIQDPDEQVRVAQDFIRNLAALHRLDPHDLALPSFGPVKTAREHALDEIANMRRRATQPSGHIDPLVRLSLDWLERNVPELRRARRPRAGRYRPGQLHVRERQGHRGRRLGARPSRRPDGRHRVALVAHRPGHVHALPRPAARVRGALRQHDRSRNAVWYYRLFAETRLTSNSAGAGAIGVGAARGPAGSARHRQRDHLRDAAPPSHHRSARERDGLRASPGRPARRAAARAVARLLRRDAREPPGDRAEDRRPLGVAVDKGCGARREVPEGSSTVPDAHSRTPSSSTSPSSSATIPTSLADGRRELAVRVGEGTVNDEDYVRYLWRQVQRDDYLMRTASGRAPRAHVAAALRYLAPGAQVQPTISLVCTTGVIVV